MVKRSHCASACSSEYEEKPSIVSSDPDDTTADSKKKPKHQITNRTARKSASPKKSSTPREPPRVWTLVEDEIFYDLMTKLVKSKMWEVVKDDGRLGYRGNQGILAHVQATSWADEKMNKLKVQVKNKKV